MVNEQRTRRILLVPTYFGRPYNSMTRVGDVQVICYPIATPRWGRPIRLAPPSSTLRLYRALAMRAGSGSSAAGRARSLLDRDLERARASQAHREPSPCRAPERRLVTVTAQGNMTYYSLRRDRAEEAGLELRSFLHADT